jgi:hypothetical protein
VILIDAAARSSGLKRRWWRRSRLMPPSSFVGSSLALSDLRTLSDELTLSNDDRRLTAVSLVLREQRSRRVQKGRCSRRTLRRRHWHLPLKRFPRYRRTVQQGILGHPPKVYQIHRSQCVPPFLPPSLNPFSFPSRSLPFLSPQHSALILPTLPFPRRSRLRSH